MRHTFLAALVAAAVAGSTSAYAVPGFSIAGSVGGAPTGVTHENFDSCSLGMGVSCTTPSGIVVTSVSDGGIVMGSSAGLYAAPFLSGSNGVGFGPGGTTQPAGPDATPYLAAGATSTSPGANVTLTLPGLERYIGILWGSVDTFNTLSLYNGSTLVGTITGSDVTAAPDGNQGVNGTLYVNINALSSAFAFDTVVLTSTSHTFEADNVAFNPSPIPEPAGFALLGVGFAGLGLARGRRSAS